MVSKYVPFLKIKQGEVLALASLTSRERLLVTPLMELPRDDNYTELSLKNKIDTSSKQINKYCPQSEFSFFVDNYEVPDEIRINNDDNYKYLLDSFGEYRVHPVCGLDRTQEHNDLSINYARSHTRIIGIRITRDYFPSILAYVSDLKSLINRIGGEMGVVVFLDCRLVSNLDIVQLQNEIEEVVKQCSKVVQNAIYVVAGSSLPSSASMYMGTNEEILLDRLEVQLYEKLVSNIIDKTIALGDYATVSPDFSEFIIDPRMMQNVITARITYSTMKKHYVIRGGTLKQFGLGQYFDLAATLVGKRFYRGEKYSWGDCYFKQKSERQTPNCTASTIIRPQVNAHLAYMINQFS